MASALINNTVQVFFDSVMGMDHEGMVTMFEALLASGLSGFLGCSSAIYEAALVSSSKIPQSGMDMVTPTTRKARGYAVKICVLLKNAPDLELGESKEFPPQKILTAKTVGTYIAKNKNIYVDEDVPAVEKPAEKKKALSKKRHAPTVEAPVVAQEAIPIQMISSMTHPVPKRKAPKRKLQLPAGSDDEIVEKEPSVESVIEQQREKTTADEVDKIIDQIISETAHMETDMEEPSLTRSDDIIVEITTRSSAVNDEDDNLDRAENESARKMASFTAPKQFLKEPLRSGEDDDISGLKQPSKIIVRRSDISTTAEYFVEEPLEMKDHGKEIETVETMCFR
ncbi:splicing factor 3B subunit 1-like [Dorcoceras hygrometricum]|uniref:Splicing factor 3B subunit 1-like n=1 Tax=Dorcoceras hygrometricum TaxID=472368 RepID=A0A2Z7CMI5_9LAMI|nr:splicing factor 3B subunit 1-like [Dorcoceras hygrometricum]